MQKLCRRCGTPFLWRAGPQHWCSFECSFWDKLVHQGNGCIEWRGARDRDGYGIVRAPWSSAARAHRVAYELAAGDIPPGKVVMHSCDNPVCCNPLHLSLGTVADNNRDRDVKGRTGRVKVNADQAAAILADPRPIKVIADQYKVSRDIVSNIKRRVTWKHVAS